MKRCVHIFDIDEDDLRAKNRKVVEFDRLLLNLNDVMDELLTDLRTDGYDSDLAALDLPMVVVMGKNHDFIWDKNMLLMHPIGNYFIDYGIQKLCVWRSAVTTNLKSWRCKKDKIEKIYRITVNDRWKKDFRILRKTRAKIISHDAKKYVDKRIFYDYDWDTNLQDYVLTRRILKEERDDIIFWDYCDEEGNGYGDVLKWREKKDDSGIGPHGEDCHIGW